MVLTQEQCFNKINTINTSMHDKPNKYEYRWRIYNEKYSYYADLIETIVDEYTMKCLN